MRKILIVAIAIIAFSCKKREAEKYCWECETVKSGGFGDQMYSMINSFTHPCDLTVDQAKDLEKKAAATVNNRDGTWAKTEMKCTKL